MMKKLLLILTIFLNLEAIEIIKKPIVFDKMRMDLTKDYIKNHYGLSVDNINIIPKMIVIHHTAVNSLKRSFHRFNPSRLLIDRKDIAKASLLNVSAHFLVARDGTIYSLMNETHMARHVIGLNYSSIGIENVGGQKKSDTLTKEQLEANIKLVNYLKKKYKTIEYLIAHSEYLKFKTHELWLEKDNSYKTIKSDPHKKFMKALRKEIKGLKN
ncbi:N-acetylmuramoyl-L-alanine amidase [Poseidonibacter parvus]|uniref:N-acetylmuramoyl-L-alanine amidase n=1 Tax=Poseidonibacter parvus TaxID=1850254 RepID=A0A1P8KLL4_9BACT|nr:peptidoglycan recognition family protein [Poseidonibacter parvus]APW65441.1 N-acetylmuramoyl-L-alanine amidase [Poseidonibacter parvus]